MAGEGAHRDVITGIADVGEFVEATDVDEHGRRSQPQLHQREERVTASEEFGFVAVLGQEGDGLLGRLGPLVVEGGGDHFVDPAAASTDFTMLW